MWAKFEEISVIEKRRRMITIATINRNRSLRLKNATQKIPTTAASQLDREKEATKPAESTMSARRRMDLFQNAILRLANRALTRTIPTIRSVPKSLEL
jgi:hypothetical protein